MLINSKQMPCLLRYSQRSELLVFLFAVDHPPFLSEHEKQFLDYFSDQP